VIAGVEQTIEGWGTWDFDITIPSGHSVVVDVKSTDGSYIEVDATIIGEEWPATIGTDRLPEKPTEPEKPKEKKAEPVRSLGDMIEEMKREEVKV